MQKKTKSTLLVISLLLIALIAGGSIAYYTKEATVRNVITASNVKIDLILEEQADGKKSAAPASVPVLPGREVSRIASGKNIGDEPFYVRAKAEVSFTDKEGNTEVLPADGVVRLQGINRTDWTYQDGFYYYKDALNPGETTSELFTSVSFDPSIDSAYSGGSVKLHVEFQATQAVHNSDSALTAAGWPE